MTSYGNNFASFSVPYSSPLSDEEQSPSESGVHAGQRSALEHRCIEEEYDSPNSPI